MESTIAAPEDIKVIETSEQMIPKELIYEVLDGKPIYFKGYKDVLNKTKTLDDIMATGRLQTLVLSSIYDELLPQAKKNGLKIVFNEVGIHVSLNLNFSCDLVAFDKTALAATEDDIHYYNIPPEFVIEVDTNGDFTDTKFETYFYEKSKKLIEFGAKKVFWILTASKTVTCVTSDEIWITHGWHKPIEIFDGHPIILDSLFKENGIKI
jgi:Putative restriction endonuclease